MIEAHGLERTYELGEARVEALRGVDVTVRAGEYVAISGPSGSGKSTLMHILGLLERPTAGRYTLAGADTAQLDDDRRATLRNRTIGFVFQAFHLIAGDSALENVAAPLVYRGLRRTERLRRAHEALERVGLAERVAHAPSRMSGGERQRVAIARALVGGPSLLLADEPTGNLDSASGRDVLLLLEELVAGGLTVIVVTHDPAVAARTGRVLRFADGTVVG